MRAERLCKAYGGAGAGGPVHALRDISFALAPGEVLGVVGRSGAGKTTLLRLLSLQTAPDSGVLSYGAQRVGPRLARAELRRLTRQTSTVFQGFSLLYNRSVLDNVALPLKLRGVTAAARAERAREMLDFVGLAARAEVYPITLSGGEAQRVAIARALVTDPSVLFLDEPTSALDAGSSLEVLDLLRKAQRRYPLAMVLVAHHMNVVRYMCDRVLHLEQGACKRLGPITRSGDFQTDRIEDLWEQPHGV